jgi:hypothetical protein
MNENQREKWRQALAARAKATRRQRGKHRKPAIKPGMIRKPPPPKETPA